MYCNGCGKKVNQSMSFCSNCGQKLNLKEDFKTDGEFSLGVTTEELQLFVGRENVDYYMSKWRFNRYSENNNSSGWNWAAFLFPLHWMGYRKMYVYVIVTMLISLFLYLITPKPLVPLIALVVSIFGGVYGNKLYYNHAIKKITKIKENEANDKYVNSRIVDCGGTNIIIVFVFILVQIINIFIFHVIIYTLQ
ncbi:DUF2628 domain-containing protein [Clostridium sp. Marseille-Q7071]